MTEISNEYATALFSLALEAGKEKEYCDCLGIVSDIFKKEPDYLEFLSCPSIPKDERTKAIDDAFGAMPEHMVSFLKILCERGRILCFEECFEIYKKLLAEHEKRKLAVVTSAVELTEAEKSALIKKLSNKEGCTVTLECRVDPSIMGGLIIETGGKVLDGSIRAKLSEVKDVITK